MSETTAHLCEFLEAKLFAIEDSHEGFSLRLGIGVGSLAELLCATNHISLVEGGKLGEALLLVLDTDVKGAKQLTDHSVTHLNVDVGALNGSTILLGDQTTSEPAHDFLMVFFGRRESDCAICKAFHGGWEFIESA